MSRQVLIALLVSCTAAVFAQRVKPSVRSIEAPLTGEFRTGGTLERKPARDFFEMGGVSEIPTEAHAFERKAANANPVISTIEDAVEIKAESVGEAGSEMPREGKSINGAIEYRAALTSPRPGATLASPQLFQWNSGIGARGYWLWVGSCQDCTDLFDGDMGLQRSALVSIPTNGRRIYVTLFTFADGLWWWYDYTFTAPSGSQRAYLVNPSNGSTLGTSQTFTWNTGSNVSQYWLWVGSCQDCTDILDESQGRNQSRALTLPADGRKIFVTLFSLMNGDWYWVDYEFRAQSRNYEQTLVVTNKLVYTINLSVNGRVVGSVPAGETRQTTATGNATTLSWDLVRPTVSGRPIGDTMGGSFSTIHNGSGRYTFTVDAVVGSSSYFVPNVTNRTPVGLLGEVNGGLQSQNRCNCVAGAFTDNVRLGYYRLFSNSNLRLYRDGSGYAGRYIYWSSFSDRVEEGTGLYRVVANSAP